MPEYSCRVCGRPTTNTSKRCDDHQLGERPRGNAFEPTREAIYVRDGGQCQECGRRLTLVPDRDDSFHVGHVIPRDKGGSDRPENLQAECRRCNLKKGPHSGER